MFYHMIIHRVFECKPELWVHINVDAPYGALDNLFAFGAAAIAANIRDHQLGKPDLQKVSIENWRLDYHEAHALIRAIRWDVVRQATLNDLQEWIMDLAMSVTTGSPVS